MSTSGSGPALEIITPSYDVDYDYCALLSESIGLYAPPGTIHRVIVPSRDLPRFTGLASDLVKVQAVDEFLPRHFLKAIWFNFWLNIRSPWPPIRGWIVQQLVKLAAAANSSAEAALLVDSDITFIRSFSMRDYADPDSLPLYRLEGAVHDGMQRHVAWDRAARSLLGLPPKIGRANDYICCPCLWRPSVVRSLLERVSATSGSHWSTTLGRQLHFSEMVLYGTYVEEVHIEQSPVKFTNQMLCANHYEEIPLNAVTFNEFLRTVESNDRAVMISAKSGTPMHLRRQVLSAFSD